MEKYNTVTNASLVGVEFLTDFFRCKTICAQLPRLVTSTDVDYDLTAQQQKLKTETHSYYLQYIRSLPNNKRMLKHEKELEDYVITNQKRVLMEQFRIKKATCPLLVSQPEQNLFVPLTPYQIHDVIVTPKFIQLGKVSFSSNGSYVIYDCNIRNTNMRSLNS